ncbi:ArgE/DapE family deacylase [Lactobacillus sp. CC-MHH1034]|uniref:ArgE/DapE family deacylase n=1 Tax=Agrilactobacillus fermenti TaxID=2586909 RepID=UPI001E2B32E4|nr:ArgE/DapE family deacylase [Agrilactobacillus fermenti]MCD2256890.1 ArgE/DapE family deacylase [Agrilactobacillus fermenti]
MGVFSETDKVKLLTDLVAIPSVNDYEQKVAEYLKDLLAKYDITAKLIPITATRADLVAEIGSGQPVLGISGHMDVVAPGDQAKWASDPFKLTETDGRLVGRGADDMKSGLAAMVMALIELKAQGLPKNGTIRLMATAGEEVGEQGSQVFYEKGYMQDVAALIIGEPSGYNIVYAHKGSVDIRLTSHGKAAHSSMPSMGYNAIDPLLNLLHEANGIFREDTRENSALGKLSFNTTIFQGGNQVNSIPEQAVAEINVRTIPEFDNDEVEKIMKQLVQTQNDAGAKIDLDIYMSQSSVQAPGDSKLVQLASQIGAKYAGESVPAGVIPAVTDASNLLKDKAADFPMIVFGPGNNSAHQVDEYVDKQMYLDFSALYVDLFKAYFE